MSKAERENIFMAVIDSIDAGKCQPKISEIIRLPPAKAKPFAFKLV
jgi:hypothetical protein